MYEIAPSVYESRRRGSFRQLYSISLSSSGRAPATCPPSATDRWIKLREENTYQGDGAVTPDESQYKVLCEAPAHMVKNYIRPDSVKDVKRTAFL